MSLLDCLYPKFCLGCGRFGTYCCLDCLKHMPVLPYLKCPECGMPAIHGQTHPRCRTRFGIDGVISLYPYTGIIKQAIKGIKYRFAYRIVEDVLQALSEKSILLLKHQILTTKKNTCLVPIPLHPSRFRMRGFNQAEIIAGSFSTLLSIPVQKGMVERTRKTPPQVEMKRREDRIENMKQAFSLRNDNGIHVKGASIVLVDDVFTTGSTLKSAAFVLKQAGVRFVFGLTIAQ